MDNSTPYLSWPISQEECLAMLDGRSLSLGGDYLGCNETSQPGFETLDLSKSLDGSFMLPSPISDDDWWADPRTDCQDEIDSHGSGSPRSGSEPSPDAMTTDIRGYANCPKKTDVVRDHDKRPRETEMSNNQAEVTEHNSPTKHRGVRKCSLRKGGRKARISASAQLTDSDPCSLETEAAARRRTHNHVERRYRIRLSEKFEQLLDLLDMDHKLDATTSPGKEGAARLSKGDVLDLAMKRIRDLEERDKEMTQEKEVMRAALSWVHGDARI
ncbi:hypothetical protein GQ53DRAFT_530613 [Thozetella sp. PMI_491]|nr:hypothetical protein GQ53DRAFT_530613 [Thozetella sp. PMI_491]